MKQRGSQFTESGIVGLEGLHPALGGTRVPTVITGRVARHVMEQADIIQHHAEAPHIASGGHIGQEPDRGYPDDVLYTSQSHLHVPTLNRYARGDIPEFDSDYDYDDEPGTSDVPYEPETYQHQGKTWVAEGHHRIIAQRLGRGY
jgi:hypothetical protein